MLKRFDGRRFQLSATSGGTAIVLSGTGSNNQYFETDVVSFQVGANASQTITDRFW